MVEGTEDPIEFRLELQNRTRTNFPVEVPPDAPVNTPGGLGPGEPNTDPNGTGIGTGTSTGTSNGTGPSLTGTTQPYYYFPGNGGMGTGEKGKP